MIRIPTRRLFLNCTENPFYYTYTTQNRSGCILLKERERKKIPLLGKAVPCSWWRIPILLGPLLGVNCLTPLALPSPPAPASHKKNIYSHTDNINMPAASVGRIFIEKNIRLMLLKIG
jgi:hypothetical protein